MPKDAQSKPPTLDYQPVTNSRRRIPPWLVVFLVGVAFGLVWPLATMMILMDLPEWVNIPQYPGAVVYNLVDDGWHVEWIAGSLALFTVGLSYGLLALLVYAVYRRLRRWRGGSGA